MVPRAVSLVASECQSPTNILKVTFNHPSVEGGKRGGIAVCSKALHYPTVDVSARWRVLRHFQMIVDLGRVSSEDAERICSRGTR